MGQKITFATVLHEATLSFLCTVYVPSSTNEAHTHKHSPQATKLKKGKKNKQAIHNHTGQKPGAPDRREALVLYYTHTDK